MEADGYPKAELILREHMERRFLCEFTRVAVERRFAPTTIHRNLPRSGACFPPLRRRKFRACSFPTHSRRVIVLIGLDPRDLHPLFLPFKGPNHVGGKQSYLFSDTSWLALSGLKYCSTGRGSSSCSVAISCGTILGFGISSAIDLWRRSQCSFDDSK